MLIVSSISAYWLIPWGVVCLLLAFFLYSKSAWYSNLSIYWRWIFRLCRALLFFLIGVLFIDFVFELKTKKKEKPILIAIVDNSSSINNYKDSSLVLQNILKAKNSLKNNFKKNYEIIEMTAGDIPRYESKVTLDEKKSDLESVFSKVASDYYNKNIGGLVFISDGNFNYGSNPLYNSDNLNYSPVFTIGVGDTSIKKDHYIKNLSYNQITFLGNTFPVEVDLEAIKFNSNTPYSVTISYKNKILAKKTVSYTNKQRDFKQLSFLLNAESVGFNRYTVRISDADNEVNYTNNKKDFYIEVIDSKNKILLLSGAPHPDITSIKNALKENQNVEIISKLISSWDKNLSGVDLVIWHDPQNSFNSNILELLQTNKKPILYLLGYGTSSSLIDQLNIGLQSFNYRGKDDVEAFLNPEFSSFELSEDFKEFIDKSPPLSSRFSKLKLVKALDVLLFQRIGNIRKKEPLIYFLKKGSVKHGVIYGEGLWRWKINEFKMNKNSTLFKELIQKTCNYLVVKSNDSPLKVSFPDVFNIDEEVIVNASFYNKSMEPITTPQINLKLTDENNEVSNFKFSVNNNAYKLNLGGLNPSSYNWEASVVYNGKKHLKSGRFIVQNISLESRDTYANHSLLKEIAISSGGSFHAINDFQQTIQDIKSRKDIAPVTYTNSSFKNLIDYKWFFFLILFLVTLEWFGRKINGSY